MEGEPYHLPILEGGFKAWPKQIQHQNIVKEVIFYHLRLGIDLSPAQDSFGYQNKDYLGKQVWRRLLEQLYTLR